MNKIYYFTGTGNSLQIAEDLSGELGESSINKIAEYSGDLIEADTLGIIFPIYFWGLPLIVCEFLKKLNVKKAHIGCPSCINSCTKAIGSIQPKINSRAILI